MALSRSSQVRWNGGPVTEQMRDGAAAGLLDGAQHVLGEARKIVPIEEGELSRSGVASVDADELTSAVSFDTPYAVVQHEDLTLNHDDGRQAKYLEQPMESESGEVAQLVADAIRGHLQ